MAGFVSVITQKYLKKISCNKHTLQSLEKNLVKPVKESRMSNITKKFSINQLLLFVLEPINILIPLDQPQHEEQLVEITLPTDEPITHIPTALYRDIVGRKSTELIDKAYHEIVTRRKLFLLQIGNYGKGSFIYSLVPNCKFWEKTPQVHFIILTE